MRDTPRPSCRATENLPLEFADGDNGLPATTLGVAGASGASGAIGATVAVGGRGTAREDTEGICLFSAVAAIGALRVVCVPQVSTSASCCAGAKCATGASAERS